MSYMWQFALVGLGGAIGAMARYGTGLALYAYIEKPWLPYATVTVNIAGCLLIGLVAGYVEFRAMESAFLRLFIIAGCLGGLTTFSTFGLEAFQLLRTGHVAAAGSYVLIQLIFGFAAAALGYGVATLTWQQS